MIDSALYHRLTPVIRRCQIRRLFMSLALVWAIATSAGVGLWVMKSNGAFYSSWALPAMLVVTFIATLFCMWWSMRGGLEFAKTVKDIETRYPDLDSTLMTAIEQQPDKPHGTLGYLQQEVVRRAVYHGYQHSWNRVVPQWQLLTLPILAAAGLVSLLIAVVGQILVSNPFVLPEAPSMAAASAAPVVLAGDYGIEPGDTEIERFTSLMILARFRPDQIPANAELVYWDEQGNESRQTMNKSLDDPLFGTRLDSVNGPLTYAVNFGNKQSQRYKISVFEYPALKRADARLIFPDFTGLDEKRAQDVRRVSAVRGTKVTWMLTFNKPISSGRLLANDGQEFDLKQDPANPNRYLVDMTLTDSARYTVKLVDDKGRENKTPPKLTVRVQGNQYPEIKQVAPVNDFEVSPVQEVTMKATFRDDFGVVRAGLTWAQLGKEPVEVEMARDVGPKKKESATYLLSFEEMDIAPNQLVTFHFWAEDVGDDGQVRRTLGDMDMITVREFESIFRQGQTPDGGGQGGQQGGLQGQQGQPGQEVIELQKEIVYAIWNVKRRRFADSNADKFVKDVEVIAESQTTAIQQFEQQAQQAQGANLLPFVEAVRKDQQQTLQQLNKATANADKTPMDDAQKYAQQAYQALLQLREAEAEVAQSQDRQPPNGGGGGGQQQNRRQMQQLDLEEDENRYERETAAQEQAESPEDRENRQVLSRLRELARRQGDLNQRVKELQSALEEAETEEEKEEIAERLKRLQQEQEQILRDTEELQDRMDSPLNQSEMSEQADKLEQARENAQQSNEALQQGDATRAAAQGTRAEQDLKELRDEFQNRSSEKFEQQMQQMRSDARELEKRQEEIADQIEKANEKQDQQKRLSDPEDDDDIQQQIWDQQSRLRDLRDNMQETIEIAEDFEPILAERLYDTYRRSLQNPPEEALDSTARSLDRGFVQDAQREQRRAAEGIRDLTEGIDEAAQAILGDETEALRRANRELQRLTNSVNRELNRNLQRNEPADESEDDLNDESANGGRSSRQGSDEPSEQDEEQNQPQNQPNGQGRGQGRRLGQGGRGQQPEQDQNQEPEQDQNQSENQPDQGQRQEQSSDRQSQGQGAGANENPEQQQLPGGRNGNGQQPNENDQADKDSENRASGRGGQDSPTRLRQLSGPQDGNGRFGADPRTDLGEDTWLDPISGESFRQWSDRMRDVEEMVDDPDLRAEAIRIRENARAIRKQVRRHAREPDWDLVKLKVLRPMQDLQLKLQEELIRRSGKQSRVPVDRDPVPAEFEDAVQNYFEQLGRGQ